MYREERSSVVFKNEGQKVFGMLHLPITQAKVPAVMIAHGFAGNKVGTNRVFVLLAEQLAFHGIATFRMDFRGSGDSEGDFKETTITSQLSDLLEGLNFLKQHEKILPKHIGILGVSLGGMLSVLAANQFEELITLALWAPVAGAFQWMESQEMILHAPNDYIEHNGKLVTRRFYEEFSRINLEKEVERLSNKPLLHIHGMKDQLVIQAHQEKYREWRNHSHSTSRFITFPALDHMFSDRKERQLMLQETLAWFKETL